MLGDDSDEERRIPAAGRTVCGSVSFLEHAAPKKRAGRLAEMGRKKEAARPRRRHHASQRGRTADTAVADDKEHRRNDVSLR